MITMKSSRGDSALTLSDAPMKAAGNRAVNSQIARPSPLRRRRLSKGLIADDGGRTNSADSMRSDSSGGVENVSSTSSISSPNDSSQMFNVSCTDKPPGPFLPKPCYSGRLALVCVQNALQMGVRTKFFLCPQGKARKTLILKSKTKRDRKYRDHSRSRPSNDGDRAGLSLIADAHEKAEEEFIKNPPSRDTGNVADFVEEYSSGDEDDFDGSVDDEERGIKALHSPALRHKEPLFIPTGTDASSMGVQGGQVPGAHAGKLPFNYRKLRFFDVVTASDRAVARNFLRDETTNANKLRILALTNHLKKAQSKEKQRIERQRQKLMGPNPNSNLSVQSELSSDDMDLKSEQIALATALTRFQHELTPTMSAALIIESLAINQQESIEGMAKCYDGIVSAGTALLDIANDTPQDTSPTHGGKQRLTTSEVMAALAPLLITTLEQSSGEVIVALAKLRNFCGTARYQRRFVQRIAPFLVRPPNAALWCLRHQSDIEPIIAATEMILDNALEVFSAGWFERGRTMLKDTQRAETLRSAASQLRRLNSPSHIDGPLAGICTSGGSQIHRRGQSFLGSVGPKKDGGNSGNESLAEWEVLAVDQHIRQSIRDVFSRDWSRIGALNLSPKEGETTPFGSRQRRGISTTKSKSEWQQDMTTGLSLSLSQTPNFTPALTSMSAASLSKSPRSVNKIPLSPRGVVPSSPSSNTVASQLPSADALESTFGPSFSSQTVVDDEVDSERTSSPTNHPLPSAPLSPRRDPGPSKLSTPKTPPSQGHDHRPDDMSSTSSLNEQSIGGLTTSESFLSLPSTRGSSREIESSISRIGLAPLSPQSSVGNTSVSSMGAISHRSAPSGGPSTMRDQYRALTSTAAERKRTVAACRALRAQITQFEEAFIQMHGRAPKGAAERAPLASTYMQYREWKRAIRADAACRIQALCRGARTRWKLLRSNDQRLFRLVTKRAGRPYSGTPEPGSGNYLDHLSIPLDIGGNDSVHSSILEQDSNRGLTDSALSRTHLETRAGQRGDDGVEVIMRPNITNIPSNVSTSSVSPSWKSRQSRGQGGGGNLGTSSNHRSSSGKSRNIVPDVTVMSLAELQQRKRELKQQLKLYDMNFHAQHGRMPEKREKEPIRHLYESYNAYKNQISVIEKGEAQPGPGTAAFRSRSDTRLAVVGNSPSDGTSSSFGSSAVSPSGPHKKSVVNTTDYIEDNEVSREDGGAIPVLSQDLAALKAEKATLHQMLRSYEKDFFKQHKRQVSSFGDIRPVASQYRRYKEIKKAIAFLQDK